MILKEWNILYQKAILSIENREEQLEKCYEMIETNLKILGATGIEDKLQDGVPETIDLLKKGGIKVWVLTGDKMETAINIGYSCNLLAQKTKLIYLTSENLEVEFFLTLLNLTK